MTTNDILKPEMDLIKSDEFYLFYEMMIQSLKTDNVKEGINKSLMLLKKILNSGHIALYAKSKNNDYVLKESDSPIGEIGNSIDCIIDKVHTLVEKKRMLYFDLNFSENIKKIMLLNIKVDNEDWILVIINNTSKELEPLFWDRACDTMQIILKRAISYDRNTKAITMDILTGLDNRNSYEKRIQSLKEHDEDFVLGIFDLFRLKYVNDYYSHDKGDIYIKAVADILNKYWPKHKKSINNHDSDVLALTGHSMYRFGGDEFILISNHEKMQLTNVKAGLASTEAEMISLGISEYLPLGLNYGIVYHEKGTSITETLEKADELMQQDKKKMYVRYNLDRRR